MNGVFISHRGSLIKFETTFNPLIAFRKLLKDSFADTCKRYRFALATIISRPGSSWRTQKVSRHTFTPKQRRERERGGGGEGERQSLTENQAGRLGRAASSQQSASNLRAFARSINGGNSSRPAATKIQFEC